MCLLFSAIAVLFFILAVSLYCYHTAFYSPPHRHENPYQFPKGKQYGYRSDYTFSLIKEFEAIPFEPVQVVAYDGKLLFGRYYHAKDDAPLHIQFHGYRGTAMRDFCGGNKLARELGHNTLVVDQRSHGKSQGHSICFGIKERFDCISWINYACCRFGDETPIILSGVSMGASTVLMASELEDLPSNVKGIIADCPFSSPVKIIQKVCADKKYPVRLTWPFIVLAAKLFGRFDICASSESMGRKKSK